MSAEKRSAVASWGWADRDGLEASIVRRLEPEAAVVVLEGPFGIGKSRLLDRIVDRLTATNGSTVHRFRGHALGGRFSTLLPCLPPDEPAAAVEWQLQQQFRRRLLDASAPPPVLVVDDLHAVDDDSLAILESLAIGDRCRVLAAVEPGHPTSFDDAVVIAVPPLDRAAVGRLLAEVFGAVDARTEAELARRTGGNPFLLRDLAENALDTGAMVERNGVWVGDLASVPASSLERVLRRRRAALSPGADVLLSVFARADRPIDRGLPSTLVQELELGGWFDRDGRCTVPAEVLSATEPDGPIAERALDLLGSGGVASLPLDTAALLGLEAGRVPDDGALTAAAEHAADRWRLDDALRLVGAVRSPSSATALLEAALLARLGRLDDASRLHDLAVERAEDDATRVAALKARADFHFFRRMSPHDALDTLTAEASTLTEPSARVELEASVYLYARVTGSEDAATASRRLVAEIGSDANSIARAQFTANAAFFDVMGGALDADPAVADGLDAFRALDVADLTEDRRLGWLRLELDEQLRLIHRGDLAAARALSTTSVRSTVAGGAGSGVWLVTLADCDRLSGALGEARRRLVSALRILEVDDDVGIVDIARADLAGVLAELGDRASATAYLDGIVEDPAFPDPRIYARVERARARLAPDDEVDGRAAEAAHLAAAFGFVAWAVDIAVEAVRRGHAPASTAFLAATAEGHPNPLLEVLAAAARALERSAADEACRAARWLFDRGYGAYAADIVGRLGSLVSNPAAVPGDLVHAAVTAAVELPRTAALLSAFPGSSLDELTDREAEIGSLAAAGLASKEIARRLSISPRTVDNHLAAVYRKTGIASRHRLHEVFPGTETGSPER